ncbi:sugar phosphate isomerase/epimerase family protein [Vallitalea okinawensis]|uniref:sugar phosphate isomerase/epimerase family protein n=1 Tax=Vallitalea okinawensis TaxID=2078660 RepID=UPI000CFBC3A4|nr:sugar phosphate isomerase/epimerase [Vallitalea okinawensis]
MRLSTSTNIMDRYCTVQNNVKIEDCIKSCAKAGYKVLDINLCDMSTEGMPLTLDNWEEWVDSIGELAATLGIEFSQSHSTFYNVSDKGIENRPWREELVRRAIIGSARLGVRWVVLHAGTVYNNGFSAEKSKQSNLEYFAPHLDLAKKLGTGIALENLFDNPERNGRKYCGTVEELIDIVDSFNDQSVGVCWDFGHGNLMGVDQNKALMKIGRRLVATHVADNFGFRDDHLAPFYGKIDWIPLMKTLKEINYQYDFTFEIHNFTDRIPVELRDTVLRHSVEIGEYLLSFAK